MYVQQLVGALREELDGFAFRRAWGWLVERHPVLRTGMGFADSSSELLQRVHTRDVGLVAVEEHDWRGPRRASARSGYAATATPIGVAASSWGRRGR